MYAIIHTYIIYTYVIYLTFCWEIYHIKYKIIMLEHQNFILF